MKPQNASFSLSMQEKGVALFTAGYMLISLISIVWLRNPEFLFYLIVMLILIAVTTAIHFKSRLHPWALWGLSIWGMAHMAGGLMPVPKSWPTNGDTSVLYNLWLIPGLLKYDQLVHAFGFGIITWICWQGLVKAFRRHGIHPQPTVGLLILCVAGGMGFGAANEIVEFIATLTIPNTNVGGYENTGWDLVANSVGCLIVAILIRMTYPKQSHALHG